jgi:uncharacterized protein
MGLKEVLENKRGISAELLLFFLIAFSTLQLGIIIPLLVIMYIVSVKTRKIKLIDLGIDFSDFRLKNILIGFLLAGFYQILFGFIIEPALKSWLPHTNLETFTSTKGNLQNLLIWLITSWTIGAVFEELIFRGYLLNRLIDLFGESLFAKIIIIIPAAAAFGFIHFYQGIHGVISTGIFGIFQCITYFLFKRKLLIPMVTHGAFDSISFILLYSGLN